MASETEQIIMVHVTPRSGRDEVVGMQTAENGSAEVRVRVTAAPDGGKANKAVCKCIAASLGVAKTSVRVKRGDTSRHKQISILADADKVKAWTASLPRV